MNKGRLFDRIIQVLLLLLVAVGIYGIVSSMRSEGNTAGFPVSRGASGTKQSSLGTAVYAAPVALRDIEKTYSTYGTLSVEKAYRAYTGAAGTVVKRHTAEGKKVNKGDLLFEVDPSRAGQQYAIHKVYAPESGVVTSLQANLYDQVASGSALAVISNIDDLVLTTKIPEFYLQDIMGEGRAYVSFSGNPEVRIEAELNDIAYQVNTSTRMLSVSYVLHQEDSEVLLLPGMFANVSVVLKAGSQVPAVPESAVLNDGKGSYVFMLTSDSKVEKRFVQTGLQAAGYVELLAGVPEGKRVVTAGHSSLTDGSPVRVVE